MFFIGVGIKQTVQRAVESVGITGIESQRISGRMSSYIVSSRADNTSKKYMNCFKRFEDFCSKRGFVPKPANSIHVAIYLTELLDKNVSYSVISAAFYSIKWVHNINNVADPTENSFVKNLLEAAKRLRSTPVKKDTIDTELLQELCELYKDSNDIADLRDLTMILLGYSGFLRFSEPSDLKCRDVIFEDSHFVLHIRKSKTDIYREGKDICISKGSTLACPFKMLKKYIECSEQSLTSDDYLFRPVCRSKGKCQIYKRNKPLSYTRARECIVKKLKKVAPDLNLGIHSLRASGASVASNADGVTDRCIKRHGRWRSDTAKDGYIKDSLEKKLHVKKVLNL